VKATHIIAVDVVGNHDRKAHTPEVKNPFDYAQDRPEQYQSLKIKDKKSK
jgi:hypothetical protein